MTHSGPQPVMVSGLGIKPGSHLEKSCHFSIWGYGVWKYWTKCIILDGAYHKVLLKQNHAKISQKSYSILFLKRPANSTAMWIHHTKCSMTTRWRITWIWFWNTSLNLVFTDKFTWTIRIPQTFRATAWDWVWHRKKTRFAPLCKLYISSINRLKNTSINKC